MLRPIRFTTLVAGVLLASAQTAHSGPLFLGLGMDASGSINSAEFELQRDAYINRLAALGPDLEANEVWLSINQFASSVSNELSLFEVTQSSVQSGGAVRTALENMGKLGGGTNIGLSIDDLVVQFETQGAGFFDRAIIDISTDGFGTLDTSVADALAAGIDQINCLGIGAGANCDFTGGEGSFFINVSNFDDFENALGRKLATEIGVVPAPAPWTLMALGLLAFAGLRYRDRQQVST